MFQLYAEVDKKGKVPMNITQTNEIQNIVDTWQKFLNAHNWEDLVRDHAPIFASCGTIYELPNYLNRENECFAIVDMRNISFAEPHYHPDEDIEIYFVLQGTACVVVGGFEHHVKASDVVVIPPNKAHFTIPDQDYVIACVNTPPYKPEHFIVVTESDARVAFDHEQFDRLVHRN